MKKTQSGIAHLGLLLLLVVAAVVVFAGYKVAKDRSATPAATTSAVVGEPAQTIKTTADLNSAETSLDNQNIDSDLNPSQFDQDVNSLL